MGRAKILCPHGVLGVANCKTCQREQHTDRVRELRRQQKELLDEENELQKSYARENPPKVFVNEAVKEPSKAPSVAVEKQGCGNCLKIEFCGSRLFYSTYRGAGKCPNWEGPEVKT